MYLDQNIEIYEFTIMQWSICLTLTLKSLSKDIFCISIFTWSCLFLGRFSITFGSFDLVIKDFGCSGFVSIQSKTGENECCVKSCRSINNPAHTQSPRIPMRPFQFLHDCITISVAKRSEVDTSHFSSLESHLRLILKKIWNSFGSQWMAYPEAACMHFAWIGWSYNRNTTGYRT